MTRRTALSKRPTILIILDGWGYSEATAYNAIHSANKPVWDRLWADYPHTLVNASGSEVGLPARQMGNSEVGHMNIGAGRVVDQEFTRIMRAIEDRSFFSNAALCKAIKRAKARGKAVHILGLLSPGGVHSHQEHIAALLEMTAEHHISPVYVHAFLDGRDTPPRSAANYLHTIHTQMQALGNSRFASITGRYYAMDRNTNWQRTQSAYDLIMHGRAMFQSQDVFIAVDMAYGRGETDEFVQATAITDQHGQPATVTEGDVIIFANYRADRIRQLSTAMTARDFSAFKRPFVVADDSIISMTEYKEEFTFPRAFPPQQLPNVFGDYLASLGMKQLRIAETEKYAHVTFFFNGGREPACPGEDRILIPSPDVPTYDARPEMSAFWLTGKLVQAIRSGKYDAIICNFANADMVGHTGNFDAAVKAVEAIDTCLGQIIAATQASGGEIVITADHGNAEQMRSHITEKIQAEPHTAHTSNPVPLLYIGREAEVVPNITARLCDIAPTLLHLMGLQQPAEMTGQALLQLCQRAVQVENVE